MTLLKKIITKGIKLSLSNKFNSIEALELQKKELVKLITKAKNTHFGRTHRFRTILIYKDPVIAFQKFVPTFSYESFYKEWISKSLLDKSDICWPGKIKFYALSSGTTEGRSKYLPITNSFLKSISKSIRRTLFSLTLKDIPKNTFTKQVLAVGGSSLLHKEGNHFCGDLSGILAFSRPLWLKPFLLPNKKITELSSWDERIAEIVKNANRWDIGIIAGNIAWIQLIFDQIFYHYKIKSIHEIWPNLKIILLGGVYFDPYKKRFEKYFSEPVQFVNTYLASEGYFAYQTGDDFNDQSLILNGGIYYEFAEINSKNLDDEGNLRPTSKIVNISGVRVNKNYAIIITTNSGLWRYVLGDIIKIKNTKSYSIEITGRLKQFLSVVGEHLTLEEINIAITKASDFLMLEIIEFCVMAVPIGSKWAHQWYIASHDFSSVKEQQFAISLDTTLAEMNDDYKSQRKYNLSNIQVKFIPPILFYNWLRETGKFNGQAKIPRILKGATQENWQNYLHSKHKILNISNETKEN